MANEPTVSSQLISHIARFRDDAWAPEVLRRTELCLVDSLSCFSAGLSLKHFAPNAAVAGRLFGFGEGGSKARLSPFAAAYLYGQAANALDYDDTMLIGHPGAPIIGAVLAVGASRRLSVDRLLRGIAAGYETEMILGASAAPSRERAALVRSVGVWDTVAGGVGAAVALGLDDRMLERVIGVAVAHSLLPYTAKWYERPVPALKNNMGWAAAGAVLATELAIAGQTGVTNPLEGHNGMWRMAGSDQWRLDHSLFDRPGVLRTGFKQFPVCWHLQEYLKTFSRLQASIAPDDEVTEIVLASPQEIERFCQREIFNTADVAFSLPAAFSLLLSGIEPGPEWDSLDDRADALRYRDVFRYERSDSREISLRTRSGAVVIGAVDLSEFLDRAAGGLDEAGVFAKHERLADASLRAAAAVALAASKASPAGGIPDALYDVIDGMCRKVL